ncbi:MAG: hypothetical protein ACREQQ_03260 [Candidatus Binatia bacterium]
MPVSLLLSALLTAGALGLAAAASAPSPTPSSNILEDSFTGEDGLITSHEFYSFGEFPFGGVSLPTNPSPIWEGDSGYFYRRGNWGYSGRPRDWKDRYFFRMNTRNFAIQDAAISWRYRSARFGEDGYPSERPDAVDVWLRYQTQYNLYAFQFDRTDDGFQAKRKIPAQGWSGPSDLVANKGVYYTLPTDAEQPVFGAGKFLVTWKGVRDVLSPAERSKKNFPALAHDGTTAYDFKLTVKNVPGNKVQIQAYRGGALIYSATDDGRSGIAANGETQGTHLERRYYDGVLGWQRSWGRPITRPGASGLRADDIKFWIANLVIRRLR